MKCRIIEYEAKIQAYEDAQLALKLNDEITVQEIMKHIRKLSNKQFKYIYKKDRLIRFNT